MDDSSRRPHLGPLLPLCSMSCVPNKVAAAAAMDLTLWQYQFRIIMLGDSTVGKSSLLKRYTEDIFLESINQTVGVDFYVHFLEVEPGVRVKLQFWDTAGQERFRSVTRSYYRNSVGGMLVFDLTQRSTFDHIKDWHAEVCERVQPHKVVFALVGQKSDRDAHDERAVSREEAERLAGQLGVPYMEASAKTGHNVRESFELIARRVYQGLLSGEVQLLEGWDGVKCANSQTLHMQRAGLSQPSSGSKNKKKCCD
ncbi:ras-related protein Rab-42b [Solea solea]|uniref:ras-related protein Rab-42b n=1 Tax=Solea solea TaxID=90069 RepID=UPI00272ACEED|nr:ras-related protein Rab-42b [Solea solea]